MNVRFKTNNSLRFSLLPLLMEKDGVRRLIHRLVDKLLLGRSGGENLKCCFIVIKSMYEGGL